VGVNELIDVLDAFGEKTGKVLNKPDVHRQELWHGAVHLWLYNRKGEILLQLRASTKEIFPDVWDISVAGHIGAGDTPAQATLREAAEELGIKVLPEDLQYIGITYGNQFIPTAKYHHKVFNWTYLVCTDAEVVNLSFQEEEVAGAQWWKLDDFEQALHDPKQIAQFAPHPLYLYDMAITEIRAALQRSVVYT
jgi:isopentenyl-diphosphate delta-isomerase